MTDTSETEPRRDGNGRWLSGGPSPFPAGRSKGILDKRQKLQKVFTDNGEALVQTAVDAALAGDMQALSLALARVVPPIKAQSQTVTFDFDPSLPVARQVEQVLAAIAAGQIPPDLGQQIISAIGTLSSVRATEELAERLAILEAKAVN